MAATFDNCPSPVAENSLVVLTGTTDDCSDTTHNVSMNGNDVVHQWSCSDGKFRLSFTVPSCVAGQPNVVTSSVEQNGSGDTCVQSVTCDG